MTIEHKRYLSQHFHNKSCRNDKKFDMALTGVMDGCAWCEEEKKTWSLPKAIKKGFKISRSLKGLKQLWRRLDKNKRKGTLIRTKGDFKVRKGLCHQPVTTRELFHFTICHKVKHVFCSFYFHYKYFQWSHFLDHKVKILTHLMVDHQDWFQYKHIVPSLKKAKKTVQAALKPGGGGPNTIGKSACQSRPKLELRLFYFNNFTVIQPDFLQIHNF